jgi:hypothetical protein
VSDTHGGATAVAIRSYGRPVPGRKTIHRFHVTGDILVQTVHETCNTVVSVWLFASSHQRCQALMHNHQDWQFNVCHTKSAGGRGEGLLMLGAERVHEKRANEAHILALPVP